MIGEVILMSFILACVAGGAGAFWLTFKHAQVVLRYRNQVKNSPPPTAFDVAVDKRAREVLAERNARS